MEDIRMEQSKPTTTPIIDIELATGILLTATFRKVWTVAKPWNNLSRPSAIAGMACK